jgi:squalene-associated FAD-dependent desaturase
MPTPRHIHIVGAGLAGLSSALQLALMGEAVTLYDSAPSAGGRCRSYFDRELDCRIDNGNHLVLSGNVAVQDYLGLSGALDTLSRSETALFPFMDLKTGERWTLRMNDGPIPWWIFDKKRRVPDTKLMDYRALIRLMRAGDNDKVADLLPADNQLFRRFLEPLAIATLNTELENASAKLLANLLAQSFSAGGKACQPLLPKVGLSESFVFPCLKVLEEKRAALYFNTRLRAIESVDKSVTRLDFGERKVDLAPNDWLVLAVPPWVARDLVPGLDAPTFFRGITNLHYRVEAPNNPAGFTGLVGGLAEWVFVKPGVVSVTISAADRYKEHEAEEWAANVWIDLAQLFDLDPAKIPPWRMVREKRATIAATPEQQKKRPQAYIGWKNLALAGDWTDTSLPSTIEGALRSGIKAAQIVRRWSD